MPKGYMVTIGSFDGVHVGHRALLDRVVREARHRRLKTMAVTFEMPPRMVLDKKHPVHLITDRCEKEILLRKAGIQNISFLKFSQKLSQIQPFDFFRSLLIEKYKAKGIVVGMDFRFGLGRSAGPSEMVRWGGEFEIPVWVISPVKRDRRIVSSTRIRKMILNNQFVQAKRALGHPLLVAGRVVRGQGLGKKIGFPTANLSYPNGKLLPRGVFAGWVRLKNKRPIKAVCNIGIRPTVSNKKKVVVEVHCLGRKQNLRGRRLLLELHHRIRKEKKFSSIEALKSQISRDIKKARKLLVKK